MNKMLTISFLGIATLFSFIEYPLEQQLKGTSAYRFTNYRNKNVDSIVNKSSTIFLIDKSGSMGANGKSGKPKWEEAKEAALKATSSILNGESKNQQVAFLTFSGGCIEDPTANQKLKFSSNFKEVEQQISTIGMPGGGTPLHEAVMAVKKRLQHYSANYGDGEAAKLIVLSDGAASCSQIRPKDVYGTGTTVVTYGTTANTTSNSPVNTPNKAKIKVASIIKPTTNNVSTSTTNTIPIKYFTIGFDIKPGSPAERDLQYLAGQTGGKYLNTQNEFELTRAFTKFFKVYYPKSNSSLASITFEKEHVFESGVEAIDAEEYRKAKQLFEGLCADTPEDYNALFNLALMYEANDYHIQAIEKFEEYLMLNPKAMDKDWVLEQIQLLQNDMLNFFDYTTEILKNDLKYINLHFAKIQNGESLLLAYEFMGFIEEKEFYYQDLLPKLGIEDKQKMRLCTEIQFGLNKCTKYIKKDPDNWDKNATSPLSIIFYNLEKLINVF